MPSPFPGMNPYLEQEDVWHDFHERAIPYIAELLLPQVRPHYIVKLDEHAYVHELPANERRFVGRGDDVIVAQGGSAAARAGPAPVPAAAADAPVSAVLPLAVDVERHAYVEVRDRRTREVITVIELLSPSNKARGADRDQYLAKRYQFVTAGVHLVELDLLRGGPRLPVDGLPPCDYYALVARSHERPRVGVWPVRLRDALPVIPVPLRAPDPDARLDLRQILDGVYDRAGYADYIYGGKPQPPLGTEDAAWAAPIASDAVGG